MNYKIIGADGKEYGPIETAQLRQWVSEGRLNGQSMAQAEGLTDWKPLASFPEFADIASGGQSPPRMSPAPGMDAGAWQQWVLSRDYDLGIGECVSRGWNLFKNNLGIILGAVVVYGLIQVGISIFQQIPLLGALVALGNIIFLAGPFQAGLNYFFLKNIRGEATGIGDIFSGFQRNYWQIVLGNIVIALLIAAAAIPGGVIMAISFIPMIANHAAAPLTVVGIIVGSIVILIPMIYLSVGWIFALVLIIDRQMEFWPAMELSRKTVGKHWWSVFALLVVCALVNIAGMLACCVGLLASAPTTLGAMMYAYEDIFSAPGTQTS